MISFLIFGVVQLDIILNRLHGPQLVDLRVYLFNRDLIVLDFDESILNFFIIIILPLE